MEVLTKISFEDLLADAKSLGNEIENVLIEQGKVHLLTEWLTIKEYTLKYNLASTSVVSNWINRGIIPPDCILETKNFNGIKLIKDRAFK
jgi:hypothetical protein